MTDHTASYSFPVLGPDRLDYTENCSYSTSEWSIKSGVVHLLHQVKGDSLVSEMLEQGSAQFGCIVVVRSTMYRKIFRCDVDERLSVPHDFNLEAGFRSIEIPKFMPVVIYMGDKKSIKAGESRGVHEFWREQEFKLYKGAILARGEWHHVLPGVDTLLKFKIREDMSSGKMEVNPIFSDGGYFHIYVAPDFFSSMKKVKLLGKEKVLHLNSILTHAISSGLKQLADFHKRGEHLDAYENFQAVRQVLEDKDEPTWDKDEFDPCRAACVYLPHCLDSKSSQEDNDDND